MVSFTDRVAAPPHVMVRFLDNESVFLNLDTERYFGLDQTGTRMWQVVTAAPNIDTAYQQLLDEYDVEPELPGPDRRRPAASCSFRCGNAFSDLGRWTPRRAAFFCAASCCCR